MPVKAATFKFDLAVFRRIRMGSYRLDRSATYLARTRLNAAEQPELQPAALIPIGGDPMDSEGSIPASTPEEDAASAVRQWLAENPRPNAGSVRILADHKTVVVYWKGDPPADLQQFVASQPVPVTIRKAAYSRAELVATARSLMAANKGVITAAGPNHDFSAVWITLSSKAPQTALAALRTQSAIPVESGGVLDIMSRPARHPPKRHGRRGRMPGDGRGSQG